MPELALLAGTAGLLLSSFFVVSSLRLTSQVSFGLGIFVVAWGLTVVETMLLSIAGLWARTWMLGAIGAGLALSVGAWHLTGRPRPPSFAPVARSVGGALRNPVIALLAAANAVAGVYVVVVAVAIPPLDIDVVAYHLPRIVLWMQQQAVASIPNAFGSNIEGNPPAAEIAQGVTMLLSESDRYAALVQVACLPAGAIAVGGIARRLGLDLRASLFGALLYAAFPIVALQAPTALNDLAVATALVVACYFALGEQRAESVLCAVAVGLALSTKISGILGLPSVALLAFVAVPRVRRLRVLAAGVAGCALGSWWYLYNLARTGAWDAHLGSDYAQVPSRAPDDILLRLERYGLQTLDLAGVVGRDRWVFPVVACAFAVAAALVWRSGTRRAVWLLAAGALVAAAPWLIDWAHVAAVRAVARSWIEIGRGDIIGEFPMHAEARPFPGETWFGPAFVIVLVAACLVVWRARDARRVVLLTAVLLAPASLYLVNATAFVYDGARGRFFIIAGALAATGLGIVMRVRPVAWATATIAVVTLGLSFVHYHNRPLGVRLFEPLSDNALWGEPRWIAQSSLAPTPDNVRSARLLEELLPRHTVVAVTATRFAWIYPLMGAGPWRTTRLVPPGGPIPADASYLAVDPDLAAAAPSSGWRRVPGIARWLVYVRATAT